MVVSRIAVLAGSLIAATVIQTTLLTAFGSRPGPDLLLALTAGVGLAAGPWAGAACGMAAGAIVDMLTGRLLGLGMVTRTLAGWTSGFLAGRLFRENTLVPFVIGAAASVIDQLLFILGARAFGIIIPLGDSLTRVTLPTLWYNGLLTALSFPLVYRVNKRLSDSD